MRDPLGWILVGALTLTLGACDSPTSSSPIQHQQGTGIDDPEEDRVAEVERHLGRLTDQVQQLSIQGVGGFYPDSFDGTALLADPPSGTRDWSAEEPSPSGQKDIRAVFAKFLEPIAIIDYARMKVKQGALLGSRYFAEVKFTLDARLLSGGLLSIRETYHIELQKGSGWRIVGQTRTSGRWIRTDRPIFADVTEALGLELEHYPLRLLTDPRNFWREPYSFLGGIAVGDVDGDGYPDILINRVGERWLFRNIKGRTFEDVTRRAQIFSEKFGTGALFFDYDNDGDLDLLALSYAPAVLREGDSMTLYRNDGTGRFENVTEAAGMKDIGPAISATAADVDRDGDLDVYVAYHYEPVAGRYAYPKDILDARNGAPNRLWINDGAGRFTERAAAAGVADTGWGLAAAFGDYNDDLLPDLYLANDFGRNRLYRNKGDGTFEDVTESSGVGDVGFGMGVDWGDYNGDGRLDLYIANMYSNAGNRIINRGVEGVSADNVATMRKAARGNSLLRNMGNGKFEDVTETAGVGPVGWAWDSHFLDYDNDGHLDIYSASGYISGESKTEL